MLTPGRYVGASDEEDDGEAFDTKIKRLTADLAAQRAEASGLDEAIARNLGALGWPLEESEHAR